MTGLPDSISVSQINLYLTCSLKYQFQYIDRLPRLAKSTNLALGSAVHAALEWLHKERKRGRKPALEEILRVFEADWRAQEGIALDGEEPEDKLLLKGKELLSLYYHGADLKVRDAELAFTLPLVHPKTGEVLPVPLKGVMDLVEEDGSISEFKTAKKAMPLEGVADHLQLTAYDYAYRMLFREPPTELRLIQLVKTKQPKIEKFLTGRNEEDTERFFGIAKQVRRGIEAGIFVPNRGCWLCSDCEYQPDCFEWRGT